MHRPNVYVDHVGAKESDALRAEVTLLRGIMDRVPSMMAYWDAEQRCRFANAAYERWFGVQPQTLIGKTLKDLLGPLYPLNLPYIEGALRGEEQSFQREIPDPGGASPRYSHANYIPDVAEGVVRGFVAMVSDITARYELEQRLRGSAELRALVDNLPELAWTARPDGFIDFYNRRWYDYSGTTFEQMQGWGWQSVHDPRELPRVMESWARSIATRQPFDQMFPLRRRDGAFRWFLTRVAPMFDDDGELVRWVGINTDIDDQRRAQEGLRALAAVVDSADDAIMTIDLEGTIRSWNPGATRMLGYGSEEIVGLPVTRLIPHGRWPEEEKIFEQIKSGTRVVHLETVRTRKDGSPIDVSLSVSPICDPGGALIAASLIMRDVTARNKGEEERRGLLEQVTILNADLEERVRERTSELATAQAVAGVGSWSFDLASGEVEWSEHLFRIAGLERGVAPGFEQQASMYAPASWAALGRAVEHAVATGEGYELELELIRPDGKRRWTTARGQTQRDQDGKVVRLVGTLQDVTELTLARRARDRAIERMRLATSATKVGIWDWDVVADVMVWDDTMYSLYGARPDSRAGTYELWRKGLHPDDAAAAESAIRLAIAGEQPFDMVFRVRHPDGQVRHIRGLGTVQRDVNGVATRMIGVNWDVTALQTAELALRNSEALLR